MGIHNNKDGEAVENGRTRRPDSQETVRDPPSVLAGITLIDWASDC